MARTNSRGTAMNRSLVIRLTDEDQANIKMEAQRQGRDMSAMVRHMLIDARIIRPVCSSLEDI